MRPKLIARLCIFEIVFLSVASFGTSFAQENKPPPSDTTLSWDRNSAESRDPILGATVTDNDGNNIGVIADMFAANQSNITLAAIRAPDLPILIVIPVSELMTKTGNLKYWGTKRQFDDVPKRYALLAAGTSSLANKGVLTSPLSVLATPTVPNASFLIDADAGGGTSGGVRPNTIPDNPYSRAGSDIKSLWGGANSVFRRPF